MKFANLFLALMASLFLPKMAQAADTNSPLKAWQQLTNFSLPTPPMDWQTNPPTQAQLDKFDDQEMAVASALADNAQKFYLNFPGDTNAANARILELEALQSAVHFGATNRVDTLNAREQAFIDDTNFSESLRYQLRLDQIGRQLKAADESGADMDAAQEQAGRELVKEFPDGEAGYQILTDLAMNGDLLKMHDLAR